MKVITAKSAGFCFGVNRAVEMVRDLAQKGEKVATLGPIIHNDFVVHDLERLGVTTINAPEENTDGRLVVIRSHGVSADVYRRLEELGMRCADATCPYVAKIHDRVANAPRGSLVLVAGDPNHPEVQGIVGHCTQRCMVFSGPEELQNLLANVPLEAKGQVMMVAQTTFNTGKWEKCVEYAKKECTNPTIFDTICKATAVRQHDAAQLAAQCDQMVVVGGRHSSNTAKLYEICAALCPTTLVESADELHPADFAGCELIGLTAGASTPACIIKEVENTMNNVENNEMELSFEEMLNASFKNTYNGEKVTAVVTGIKPNEILVDIGTKHAGFVPMSELSDDPSAKAEDIVKVGDEIELLVVRVNDVEGTAMLSKKRLDAIAGFETVMNAAETNEVLEGTIVEVVRGGLLATTKGVRVFIPASQSGLPREADLTQLLHKPVSFRILETNRQRRRAVGSISAVLREQRKAQAEKFWSDVEVGKVYNGVVKSLTNFGVFVDLGGVDGRISLSDLCWHRVKHPSEVVSVGDNVEVTIKDIDAENKKISLIYKKAEENPWEILKNKYQVGDVAEVKIMSITGFGAFAQIIPGIDGLIHISQIAKERIEKVADKLTVGDVVEAKITELDLDKKRVSLSIRALLGDEEAPAAEAEEAAE
ncbi:MAG: bifunctional 4-hydroxy-3-methylbut-2-enyl diphosphate reductase/30S ribosomal protein S1 [Oscillospiraceae bacterium]|nr:bifunctional 4-hydroxy-3-methylbut-2-enyl diphosphate reductase/30S ribosomal protein S1 [Oscillospiraceae bacterium]